MLNIYVCMTNNCIGACSTALHFIPAFCFSNFVHAHVHGALSPSGLSHGSCPLRRSEAWGRDRTILRLGMVKESMMEPEHVSKQPYEERN